ncbi:hypothetical protein A2274_00285 [candidate division WWE3 bacterium RIFOXYA12_FULL_43_11]|uniref:IrrE N-terminal-like domain-containing protein n=2 Tax=Katanobacteria TaxID=422282 RepID=A0A0G0VQR3_UNCKA|nr:MAG: hypothetical protein UR43_C0017G0013 [candidate division TM6 bacterium GW2011_GWF2_33_332]KKS03224.1 MAG: hypothetical protein UU55_C0004G0013 [candidate division WWE3 bacterium GW2011_GWC2_41_23]OGC59195.1 MAG: hypothetical protein A2245_00330 [candidate division WWE3 bacterium RIFOXYA2_FULL_43_12]OGC65538.1 MAG: hypothetical protein A2274_00285 [candidate division WWE3 bacterium RIFOXYA12_FULL_43_11]HBY09779.1 hypothetical protein [candidate division WWE3 bacterium]HLD90710.1 ImmA/Ir
MTSNNRDKAQNILKLAGVTESPVDIVMVAKALNIKVVPYDFPDKRRGMVYLDETIKVIGVNKNNPQNLQRFTIAHELGHYLNGHAHYDSVYTENEKFKFADAHFQQEKEADLFAAELLMPKEFLIKDLDTIGLDIKKLTEKYQVSEQAMHIRLSSLGLIDKYAQRKNTD